MSHPTLTTDDIRGTWGIVYANRYRATQTEGHRDFDRWLANHDQEVREQMLVEFQENEVHALAQLEATVGVTLADAEVNRLRAQLDAVKEIVRSPGLATVKGSPADRILRVIEGGDDQ